MKKALLIGLGIFVLLVLGLAVVVLLRGDGSALPFDYEGF
jgi:hypothetical protein